MKEKTDRMRGLTPWQKGVSGNPKGRPKMPDLKGIIAEALSKPEADGSIALETIINALASKAKKGDVKAIQELFDRGFGKSTQVMEVALDQKKPEWLNYLEAEEAQDLNETEENKE